MAIETVLEIKNLTMHYAIGFWRKRLKCVLDDLSLSVNKGEVFGFLGHNGAGKTTALKILMRIVYPTNGSVKILGKPIDDVEMRRRIGFLPEAPYFYDYLTGYELLEYFGKLCGLETKIRRKKILETLELVGLNESSHRQLRLYSKGMLQRIGIAQAILNNPEIVFLDEPMSGLDPIGRREVRDIIIALRNEGKTVFFSTHILSDVEILCDRVAILRNGKRVAYGPLHEVQGQDISGLEIVATSISSEVIQNLTPYIKHVQQTASRISLELENEDSLEKVIHQIHENGARIISINPVRTTLEDFFIKDKIIQ